MIFNDFSVLNPNFHIFIPISQEKLDLKNLKIECNYFWQKLQSFSISCYVVSIYFWKLQISTFPRFGGWYLLMHQKTIKRGEMSSKLTIKAPEQHHWRYSGFFIDDFLVFLLLTLNK